MKSKSKVGVLMAIIGACICTPAFAFAAVVSSYTTEQVQVNAGIVNSRYLFGTGLSGKPDQFTFYATSSSNTTIGAAANLMSCPSSASLSNCYVYATGSNVSFTSAGLVNIPLTATTTMKSTYYYYLDTGAIQSGGTYRVYGSTSDLLPGRLCNAIATPISCTSTYNIKTGYFLLSSNPNYSTQGITTITSPTYGQVITSSNNVNFAFNYYTTSFYNLAGFNLVDNTTLQSIDTSAASTSINSSGSGSFNNYLDLVTGHTYTWTPWIKDSRGINNTLVGTSTFFFVGSQSNQSIPTIKPATWNGCNNILCQGAIISTSTGLLTWNGGTTTSPFGPFGTTFDDLVRNKAPFSYLYDIKQLLYELGNGSSTDAYTRGCHGSDAYYTLPYNKTLDSGSSTVKFIDACAVQEFGIVKEIRRTITYAIYLITGIGVAGMALSIL